MSAITTEVPPFERASSTERVLECEELRVGYDGHALLPGVAFSLHTSQLWAIVGDNGSGKTTLLKTLLGLQSPLSGELRWQERDRVGYVPQRARLDLSAPARVIDVVRGGVDRGWSFLNPFHINKHREAIAQAMRDTNTEQLAEQMFSHLSEGQKQRVLTAQAAARARHDRYASVVPYLAHAVLQGVRVDCRCTITAVLGRGGRGRCHQRRGRQRNPVISEAFHLESHRDQAEWMGWQCVRPLREMSRRLQGRVASR